ncbi:GDSL-type esterase/lipase family protein [Spirosoma aerophilum]
MTTDVRLTADTLPPGGVIDYSLDNGQSWTTGQQLTLTSGGTILTRIRAGTKQSISRSASFTIYFKRMLVIGNSIMNAVPSPEIGWFNNNGMAASAPEKDFVRLLTAQLRTLYPAMGVRLQASGNLERYYGMSSYSLDEFNEAIQQFKPDLILVRMGENVENGEVSARNFEANYRQFLERLITLSGSQPVKLVCTTSVWFKPQVDAVIRKVSREKGYTLVDLSCMVGQPQYFASQYTNVSVAAHPNDTGMKWISDLIWDKIR